MNTLESLITDWLPVPDVAEALDVNVMKVRQFLAEDKLVGVRRGERNILSIPALMIKDGELIAGIPGTVTLLRDANFSDTEVLEWLFTEDETLPGTPMGCLREGQRGEVRRRAQVAGF